MAYSIRFFGQDRALSVQKNMVRAFSQTSRQATDLGTDVHMKWAKVPRIGLTARVYDKMRQMQKCKGPLLYYIGVRPLQK